MCVFRLEGELGEDWRILGDISSLPRKTQRALKPRNEERITETFLGASQKERFETEPVQVLQPVPMKRSVPLPVDKEEFLTTTKESVKSNLTSGEEEVRPQWRKNSSSIAFLEKLLKERRNEGKARTVTFGE